MAMARAKDRSDYSGARGRLTLAELEKLDPTRWSIQPKIDGAYCHLRCDSFGRVMAVTSRTGAEYSPAIVGGILGQYVGAPNCTLVGELEAHTEAGNRAASERGYRRVHLFDVVSDGKRKLHRMPYQERRDTLWRIQSTLVAELLEWRERPYFVDRNGRAHDPVTGDFCRTTPTDWRLTPIVPQLPPRRAGELWEQVERGELEGIVAVNLRAPLGGRGAKKKCKPVETLDCLVLSAGPRKMTVRTFGSEFLVTRPPSLDVAPGHTVEVAYEGWYERQRVPRFPRVLRRRDDLRAAA